MARYDGEIRFNTKIDEKGFNKGASSLGDKIKKIGSSIASAVAGFAAGFTAVLAIVGLVIGVVSKFVKSLISGVNKVIRLGERTEALKTEFANLRASVRNAFLPLLEFALPLLQRVAAWLTKIFNFIGMILGALTGQRMVMRATADAAADAAGSSGKLAKNTRDAEKAAKGALASFDELNVLQMEEPAEEEPGGGGGVPGGGFEMVPIDENILAFFDRLREKLRPLTDALGELWNTVQDLWSEIKLQLKPLWEELGLSADVLLDKLIKLAVDGVEWLTLKVQELTKWIKENPDEFRKWAEAVLIAGGALIAGFALPLIAGFAAVAIALGLIIALFIGFVALIKWIRDVDWAEVWQSIVDFVVNTLNAIGGFFTRLWSDITSWAANTLITINDFFEQMYGRVVARISAIWAFIKAVFSFMVAWIYNSVTLPIITYFINAWNAIRSGFESAWNGILGFFKGIINKMIDFVNRLIRAVVSGLNSIIRGFNSISVRVPDWVPLIGGNSFGVNISTISAPQIPRLASGAVIPPNSEFLAVLGDQRVGRNIETPEGLMRQIVREELAGMVGGNEDINVTMPVYLDSEKIYEGQKRVQRRRGASLVTGGSIA